MKVFAGFFFASIFVFAQTPPLLKGTATVSGVLRTTGGETPENVAVSLIRSTNGLEERVVSPSAIARYPVYTFPGVSEGRYRIVAENPALYPYVSSSFYVRDGETVTIDIQLTARPTKTDRYLPFVLDGLQTFGVILVLAGLFREQIMHWFFSYPRLGIDVRNESPHCHIGLYLMSSFTGIAASLESDPTVYLYFYRIWIKNTGTSEATNVEVILNRIWDLDTTKNEWQKRQEFLPLNLRWANSWDITRNPARLQNLEHLIKARISPDVGRFCDLGFAVDPEHSGLIDMIQVRNSGVSKTASKSVKLQLALEVLTDLPDRHVTNSSTLLQLVIDADNAEASTFYVRCDVSGGWSPTETPTKEPQIKLRKATREDLSQLKGPDKIRRRKLIAFRDSVRRAIHHREAV